MESLFIKGTEFTPTISFDIDSHEFRIEGVSRPEDVMGFYLSIIEWLRQYEEEIINHASSKYQITSVKLILRMTYFNSASAKSILQILERFKSISNKDVEVIIDFYYDEGDDQMMEDGEDLSEAIELPFNYIAE